jgi:uncharacterized protein YkwD
MRRVGVLLAVCLAVLLTPGARPADAHRASAAKRMTHRINVMRAAHGLPRLHLSRSLCRTSRRYARGLMRHGQFRHASRIRASRSFRSLGEILELHPSYRPRIRRTVANWLNSPSHRAVILSASMRYVGAGRARGSFGGAASTIWVAQFGSR